MHFTVAGALVGGALQSGGFRNLRFKDVKRALKHLDAVLEQHPDRTDIRGIRGLALALTGRREEAIADLEAYLEAFEDSKLAPVIHMFLTGLKAGGDFSIDSLAVTLQAARETLMAGDDAKAEALFRKVLRLASEGRKGIAGPEDLPPERMAAAARLEIARILVRRASGGEVGDHERLALHREALDHLEAAADSGWKDVRKAAAHVEFETLRRYPRYRRITRGK
jgi:tetratricopeptide (TPR) repeat protein